MKPKTAPTPPLPSMTEVSADFRAAAGAVVAAVPRDIAGVGRAQWFAFHKAIAVAKRGLPVWLQVSRAHAVERWGESFVAAFEAEERAKIKLARQQTNRR